MNPVSWKRVLTLSYGWKNEHEMVVLSYIEKLAKRPGETPQWVPAT